MLWLSLHFSSLATELREPRDVGPAAVVDRHGSRRWIISCNDAARQARIHSHMDATSALVLMPTLKLIDRSRSQERRALQALASWSEQFSSFVTFDAQRWLLWIEIGASLHYFGGLDALMGKITQGIRELGYTFATGIAPTIEASALLTQHKDAQPVHQTKAIKLGISALPVHLLAISISTLDVFRDVGWQYIGEVLNAPRDQLARRFGPDITQYLQRLLGEAADPREPYRAPATYRRRLELSFAVDATEPLLFPLRRMLGELQGYLRGRDMALQDLQLTLVHEKNNAAASTTLQLHTTQSQRDAQALWLLLREMLERTALPAATVELIISVKQFVAPDIAQLDFFDDKAKREQSWSNLLDKLRARLGTNAVKHLGLKDDHLPEKAWCVIDAEKQNTDSAPVSAQRPLWLIQPKLIQSLPNLIGKPERIECNWWQDDMQRDYYIAETPEGSRWWLYRDVQSSQWYLHGLWG
ncbi:MAG TPA: DNA polymerase Y family protein [Steroidobacteraceae bacterium]|jgi:protein ImuB|nr:DNA polymerase Y family protein [Steroidobacteraceae bacterium]